MSQELDGYWPSPWPAEDGGPTRRQTPATGFSLAGDRFEATTRHDFGFNMVVLRNPGEVYLQGNTLGGPDTTSWVERIDPITLECLARSPDLVGGPFWAGGIAAHANGDLYVTYGRWCHRLDPDTLQPRVSIELPRARPYNSLLILPDGHLAMKDFCGGKGVHAITNGDAGSQLIVLDPESLTTVASHTFGEGSIARISAVPDPVGAGATIVVVGDYSLLTLHWDGVRLEDCADARRYLTLPGQTFGWDAVLADGSAWFLDNGEGTTAFGPSFSGKGVSTAPLHLVRVDLSNPGAPLALAEVNDQPGAIIANPPAIDTNRNIAVGYDSGNGVLTAFTYPDDPTGPLSQRWKRDQHHGGHMLLDSVRGLLLTFDFDHDRGTDQAVVVDLDTGATASCTDTGSPVQTVLFPAPGWNDDFYLTSFTTLTRMYRP